MTFLHLETIEIGVNRDDNYNLPLHIIQRNRTLKSISFPWLDMIDVEQVLGRVGPLPALEELKLLWRQTDDVFCIARWISEYEALRNITFCADFVCQENPIAVDAIEAVVPHEWQVNVYLMKTCIECSWYHVVISRQVENIDFVADIVGLNDNY